MPEICTHESRRSDRSRKLHANAVERPFRLLRGDIFVLLHFLGYLLSFLLHVSVHFMQCLCL